MTTPFVRGPLRMAEAFAVLPDVRRALPEARFPFERPRVAVAVVAGAAAAGIARRSRLGFLRARKRSPPLRRSPLPRSRFEAASSPRITAPSTSRSAPTRRASRRRRSTTAAAAISSGPLLLTSAAASALAARAPASARPAARALGAVGAIGAAVEIFGWMGRHPEQPLSRALARPGHELQTRISTAEPSAAQLEVAEAALAACLEAEEPA